MAVDESEQVLREHLERSDFQDGIMLGKWRMGPEALFPYVIIAV